MILFNLKQGKLTPINEVFSFRKDIQKIVENNIQSLFGLLDSRFHI